jgi:hypothetical protein
MKIFNLVFCLLFIVSAGLQYNDPDPYLWIPIYLIGASVSFFAIRNIYFPRLSLLFATLFTVYCVFLFFNENGVLAWLSKYQAESITVSMQVSSPWIENTREFFGLTILTAVLMINYFVYKNKALKN